jgi:hypothetical protein
MIALAWVIIQFVHIRQHVKRVEDLEQKDAADQIPALANSSAAVG